MQLETWSDPCLLADMEMLSEGIELPSAPKSLSQIWSMSERQAVHAERRAQVKCLDCKLLQVRYLLNMI